jgi:hypothetical protein
MKKEIWFGGFERTRFCQKYLYMTRIVESRKGRFLIPYKHR